VVVTPAENACIMLVGWDVYDRLYRLKTWAILLGAGLVLSRLRAGAWISGPVEDSAAFGGGPVAINAPVEMLIFALVRIPVAVLLAHAVKRTLFRDFETSSHPILSGLVYIGTVLGVVLA